MQSERGHVLVAASFIVFGLALGASGLTRPLGQDDTYHLMAARILAAGRPILDDGGGGNTLLFHAPLYPWMISKLQGGLGPHVWAARLVGLAGFGTAGALLLALVLGLAPAGPERGLAALLALGLYALSPMAIQGVAVPDIDTAVLPSWTLLWVILFLRFAEAPSGSRLAALAGAAAMGWGFKLSTPSVAIVVGIVAVAAAAETRRLALSAAGAAVVGAGVFAGAYSLWGTGRGLSVFQLVGYIAGRAAVPAAEAGSTLAQVPRAVAELALWMSPFLLLLGAGAVGWALTGPDLRRRVVGAIGGVLLFGYLVVGGTPFSYPRYHAPALPLLCALVGLWVATALVATGPGGRRAAFLLCALVAAWDFVAVGDLLYLLRYTYRGALARGDPGAGAILWTAARRSVALFVPAILILPALARWMAGWRPRLRIGLIVMALGGGLALDGIQVAAPFGPTHYGETGGEAVAQFLRGRLGAGARVIATREILFYLDKMEEPASWPLVAGAWNDPARFRAELEDPRLGAVVYGIAGNTIAQYRHVFRDPAVCRALEGRFRRQEIGGYTVWWRQTM